MIVLFKHLPEANGSVQFVLDAHVGKTIDASVNYNLRHVGKRREKYCARRPKPDHCEKLRVIHDHIIL